MRRVEPMLARHPNAMILSLRFLYGLRTAGPIALGALGVSRWRFALLNLVSAALWASLIAQLGYQFGHALQWLMPELREVEEAALLMVLAAALAWTLWRRRRAVADSRNSWRVGAAARWHHLREPWRRRQGRCGHREIRDR